MALLRDPHPEPRVDPFRDGVAELRRDGHLEGYLFSTVQTMWTPGSPLRKLWWVWYITAWLDGTRDAPEEDYPPWSLVEDINAGHFEIEWGPHAGHYQVARLGASEAAERRTEYGITEDDF